MKLNFFFVRHGMSCCNILHHKDLKLASSFNAIHKDPLLTVKGIDQSSRAGSYLQTKLPSMDYVFSSGLARAIETSLCMFPNQLVHVAPYICEKPSCLENTPYITKKQSKRLKDYNIDVDRVKFCSSNTGISDSNLKKFICYITNNFPVDNTNIAVVTHSNFLVDILNLEKRMNNNAVFKATFDTDTMQFDTIHTVFSGYQFPVTATLNMSFRHKIIF
jgi:hypothetical protein